jgi:hypothetical protein
MYSFNKNYLKGINLDYIKRVNYTQNNLKKNAKFNLFFNNNTIKKEQKKKLKQVFTLELVSLQKSLFNFSIKKNTRKITYIPVKIISPLYKKYLNYFFFFFSQFYFAHIQNFSKLAIKLNTEKTDIDVLNTIDYIKKNQEILKTSSTIFLESAQKTNTKYSKFLLIQYLSFFKFKI